MRLYSRRGLANKTGWSEAASPISPTLPQVTAQGFGSMPMRSLTADEIRLGAAEVALGRLYRDVTEEKLDLLQFPATSTTEASATPPEIVRRELAHASFGRELLDDVPDELLRYSKSSGVRSYPQARGRVGPLKRRCVRQRYPERLVGDSYKALDVNQPPCASVKSSVEIGAAT